jgi:hypothetical protein
MSSFPRWRGRPLTEAQRRTAYQRTSAKLADLDGHTDNSSPSIREWLGEEPLPPKAGRIRRTADDKPALPLEKHVLKAALKALHHDPRVAFAQRQQSGLFQEGLRTIRIGTPGVLDINGMLKGGQYFELEAKRPGQKPDERQSARIEFVRQHGGISGYFTSAEEALALLP